MTHEKQGWAPLVWVGPVVAAFLAGHAIGRAERGREQRLDTAPRAAVSSEGGEIEEVPLWLGRPR